MSLGFDFSNSINPHNPIDSSDPPPEGWDTGIDTSDYRSALFGFPSQLFKECCAWEKRELEKINKTLKDI